MNAGTKYFAPAIVSNIGLDTNAISYAIDSVGVEIVFTPVSSDDVKENVRFHGLKNKELQEEIRSCFSNINDSFPWKENLKTSISIDLYNKIPNGSGLSMLGSSISGFLVALNVFNKRPFEQRKLYDFVRQELGDDLSPKTYNDIACSLIGGMVVGYNGANVEEYQRISCPPGFSSVLCIDTSAIEEGDSLDNIVEGTDVRINSATQLALILYKSNLDSFVAFCDRHFELDKLSLLGFESEFCQIAKEFDIQALFRPSSLGQGLVALAINSFKASELSEIFNKSVIADNSNGRIKAIQVGHNLDGVYRF